MQRHERTSGGEPRARKGAALALTLFVIVALTTLSAGAFTMIVSERKVNDDKKAQLDSYLLARRGLEQFTADAADRLTSRRPDE